MQSFVSGDRYTQTPPPDLGSVFAAGVVFVGKCCAFGGVTIGFCFEAWFSWSGGDEGGVDDSLSRSEYSSDKGSVELERAGLK
jgi:hypothetical protein